MFGHRYFGARFFAPRYFGPRLAAANPAEVDTPAETGGGFYYLPRAQKPPIVEPPSIAARARGARLRLRGGIIAADARGSAHATGADLTLRLRLKTGKARGAALARGADLRAGKIGLLGGDVRGSARAGGAQIRLPGGLDIERDNAFLLAS